MSGCAAVLTRTFTVGRFECTLTFPPTERGNAIALTAEWSPHVPKRLSSTEIAEYRAGRDSALKELAAIIGGNVAVIE